MSDPDALLVAGSTGQPRVNPAVAELRSHRLALSRLLRELDLPAEALAPAPRPVATRHDGGERPVE